MTLVVNYFHKRTAHFGIENLEVDLNQDWMRSASVQRLPNSTTCSYDRHAYLKFIPGFLYGRPHPILLYLDSQGCRDGRQAYLNGFCDFLDF